MTEKKETMESDRYEEKKKEIDKRRSEELMKAGMLDNEHYQRIKDRYDRELEQLAIAYGK